MKPILYGLDQISKPKTIKVPSEKVNVEALIDTLEKNLDKTPPKDWLDNYEIIRKIYMHLFTHGELSDEIMNNTDYDILEMARDDIGDDIYKHQRAFNVTGYNYYYEFARSICVEKQASELKEFLDEDCDFI